ncbi:hypothetical protein BC628DRAFT_1418573 [Trametes gibbosa]|nr:hypothetical protein BC628DRAFT_1418573 [Trametes gibbosa]
MSTVANVPAVSSISDESYEHPRNYTRQTKPHTAWFGSEGTAPITAPPPMGNQHDVRSGDLFCHKTPEVCQLWVWTSGTWRPVNLGYQRPDGRCLSLTKKKKEPSWVGSEWCAKRMSAIKNQAQAGDD